MQISTQNSSPLQIYQQHTDKVVQGKVPVPAQQDTAKKTGDATATAQNDSVTLSNNAKLLAEANRAASTEDGSRASMIARLREQVQNGTYVIDDRSIAEGIVREDKGLFTV